MKVSRKIKPGANRRPVASGLTSLIFLYAVVMIAWLIGRELSGDQFLPIRWANFMAPWMLSATIGLIFFAGLKQRWLPTAALAAIFALMLCLTPLAPKLTAGETPPTAPTISVLSFNIGHFNQKYDQVAKLINDNPADIIFLQEVAAPQKLIKNITIQKLNEAYHHHTDKITGLVILSRAPIKSANRLQGVLTRYRIAHSIGEITLWNIHVPRSVWSIEKQTKLLANLSNDLEHHPGPKIIAGDFNLTPYNHAMTKLSDQLNTTAESQSILFTYPTPLRPAGRIGPWVQIDHILTSPHFSLYNHERIKNYAGSDHYAIKAQLKFRGNAYTGLGTTGIGGIGDVRRPDAGPGAG